MTSTVTVSSVDKASKSSITSETAIPVVEGEGHVQAAATSSGPQSEPATSSKQRPVASSPEGQLADKVPFHWPEVGRGDVVLSEADYKKMMDGVLDQFYDGAEIVASTKSYIDQVASLADELTWGKRVTGTHSQQNTTNQSVTTDNLLDTGLIRKRKKPEGEEGKKDANEAIIAQPSRPDSSDSTASQPAAVNLLSAGLVRKKKKT
jgi:regulator of Ty1 transposition protein 109